MVGRGNCGGDLPIINRRKPDWCLAKYGVAIPAVPLRSVPSVDVNVKDYDEGANKTGYTDKVLQKDELLKSESDNLAAVIAEANEFMNLFDARNSTPTSVEEQKLMMETDYVSATPVMLQNSDTRFYGKRLKLNSGKFLVSQEGKEASETVTTSGDNEDEVSILSPVECNVLRHGSNHKVYEKLEFDRGSNVVDNGTKCRDHQEHDSINMDLCSPISNTEQDYAMMMICADEEAIATNSTNHELINFEIVGHDDPKRRKVIQALQQFKEEYELELGEGKNTKYPHFEAAKRVKAKGMNISTEKPFGHIPGIQIGDEFSFRAELTIVGLNRQFTSGIDFVTLNGKQYATSIVNSGRHRNETKEDNILIYSGQGDADQKLERGNLAMVNSLKMGYPIRVIHKKKSKTSSANNNRDYKYVYDGLYMVNRCWQDRENKNYRLVFKFELQRLSGQPCRNDANNVKENVEVCMLDDLSQGKERFKVGVMNGVDEDLPPPFNYITKIVYPPHWFQWCDLTGCDCIEGCSDSVQCPCVVKNVGEIPYTEEGLITRARTSSIVHECGPSCKCPPSCMNRVSQHGPRFQLEIFKTKLMGWGVRSRDHIAAGSFICEYVGELVGEKEANQRIGNDEYLFDVRDGRKWQKGEYAIDGAKCGNVSRFMNHSCDPNVFAQKVVYGDDGEGVPCIMFFAGKSIPAGTELRYDYNYSKMRVCDADGNIKRKPCYCGSRKCSGRLY